MSLYVLFAHADYDQMPLKAWVFLLYLPPRAISDTNKRCLQGYRTRSALTKRPHGGVELQSGTVSVTGISVRVISVRPDNYRGIFVQPDRNYQDISNPI